MLTSHQHESNGGRKLGIADLFTLVPTERVGLGPNHFIHAVFKAQFSFSKRVGLPLWLPGPTMCKKRMQNGCVVHQSPESIILLNQGGQSKSPFPPGFEMLAFFGTHTIQHTTGDDIVG